MSDSRHAPNARPCTTVAVSRLTWSASPFAACATRLVLRAADVLGVLAGHQIEILPKSLVRSPRVILRRLVFDVPEMRAGGPLGPPAVA
jgi:hypothetical protein